MQKTLKMGKVENLKHASLPPKPLACTLVLLLKYVENKHE